jgi:phosphomannomutase
MSKMLMIDKKIPNLPYKIINIQYIDGLKINLENGYWISLRFSGTEPLLRLIYEVSDEKMGSKIIASFEKFYKI